MAFPPNHLSQDMALQHFSDSDNSSVLRRVFSDQLTGAGQSSPSSRSPVKDHWLNTQILRSPVQYGSGATESNNNNNILNLQTNNSSDSPVTTSSEHHHHLHARTNNQWLSRSTLQRNDVVSQVSDDPNIAGAGTILPHDSPRLNNQVGNIIAGQVNNNGGGELGGGDDGGESTAANWQNARYKAENHYVLLLCSFKEQLQQHVRVHAMEAVMACWEIEQSLQSLTGVSPGEGTGATMSDDEEDQFDNDASLFDGSLDVHDSTGFGPLVPTDSERSLMERVRQELKHDLKQGYKEKIVDIREEILRKRRAGKLPGDTTSILKSWWQSHAKWPYPTEEDKAKLVQETGLQLKQINNWFINQRKRNWHSNPSSSTILKSKRKR